jgi:hypothetical protein
VQSTLSGGSAAEIKFTQSIAKCFLYLEVAILWQEHGEGHGLSLAGSGTGLSPPCPYVEGEKHKHKSGE